MKSYFLLPLYLLMMAGSLSATGTNHNPVHPTSWPPLYLPCFQPAKIVNTGTAFVNNTLADVNGDGLPDLITNPQVNPNTISVLLNRGDGSFGSATYVDVGGQATSVQMADMNGDGKPDLIAQIKNGYGISVVLNNGNGNFRSPQLYDIIDTGLYDVITIVRVTDLNGDSRPDLVLTIYDDLPRTPDYYNTIARNSSKVGVFLNNGNGTFAPLGLYVEGFGTIEVTVADVNNDNRPDLIRSNYIFYYYRGTPVQYLSNNVSVLLNRGDGTFGTIIALPVSSNGPGKPAVVDVNGDGQLDIVVANWGSDNVSIYAGNGTGNFNPPTNFVVGAIYNGYSSLLNVQDINGDNKPDLIGRRQAYQNGIFIDAVWVMLNQGNNSFGPVSFFSLGGTLLALADANGDSKLDLVIGNTDNNDVSIQVGLGNGSFADAVNFATGGIQGGVQITDINQNGKPDLIAFGSGETVSVLLGCQSDSPTQPCTGKVCIPIQITRVRRG